MNDIDEPRDYDFPDEEEARPRDRQVDIAKDQLEDFFDRRSAEVFYERQLEVIFETKFFHWITQHALHELRDESRIASALVDLPGIGSIRFYRSRQHRYWKRQAREILKLVNQFSSPSFTRALGQQAEMLFDSALAAVGFLPTHKNTRAYRDKEWTATNHDLDRIYQRDNIAYGAEVKNTLSYIPQQELHLKMNICAYLGIRPLFIVRMAPKSYIELVRLRGGFTLVFQYQLYPYRFPRLRCPRPRSP